MNPGRYFIPNTAINPMMVKRGYGIANSNLFGKLTQGLRSFNWGKFLSGANKTLNVVNQTVPLIRQAGPMVNNMKNMFHLAKVFRNETNKQSVNKMINNYSSSNNSNYSGNSDINNYSNSNYHNNLTDNETNLSSKKINENLEYQMPTFFL